MALLSDICCPAATGQYRPVVVEELSGADTRGRATYLPGSAAVTRSSDGFQ